MATAGLLSNLLSQAAAISDPIKRDEFVRKNTQYISYQAFFNDVIKMQRQSELRESYNTAKAEHDAEVQAQEKASQGDNSHTVLRFLNEEPTPFYGYTDDEWSLKTDLEKRAIRDWAHEQAGQFITTQEVQVWTEYISGINDGSGVDAFFGTKYKYKSFFPNLTNTLNQDHFQVAESERNAVNDAKGYINPSRASSLTELNARLTQKASSSYSGCDIVPSITVGGTTYVIGNLSALSYSIHRDKVPVRTLGRTYAKSYVSGGATIAGTLIFTVFDTHVLDEVRRAVVYETQAAPGQSSPLTQQLPPFDITIFFQNEYGQASYMRIYGVEITDESQTHTINDTMSENQMQYIARDIDLMCKADDEWFRPSSFAMGNTTMFSKYNLATPSYRLQHKQDNDKNIGILMQDLARLNNESRVLSDKIAELKKPPTTPEKTNTISAYTIQLNALNTEASSKTKEIERLQKSNENLMSSQSDVDDASINLGSNTSAGRDDPYALARVHPSQSMQSTSSR